MKSPHLLRVMLSRGAAIAISGGFTVLSSVIAIRAIGPIAFGFVALVATLPAIASFLAGSTGANIVNGVAELGAEGVRPHLRSTYRLCMAYASLLLSGVCLIGVSIGWDNLLSAPREVSSAVNFMLTLSAATWCLYLLVAPAQRLLIAMGQASSSALSNAVVGPVACGITFYLSRLEADAMWYVVAQPLGRLMAGLMAWMLAWKYAPFSMPRVLLEAFMPRKHAGTSSFTSDGSQLVIQGAVAFVPQVDGLSLSHRSSGEALAEYSVVRQFTQSGYAVILAGAQSLWPAYARQRSSLPPRTLVRDVAVLTILGFVCAVGLTAGLYFLSPLIYRDGPTIELDTLLAFSAALVLQAAAQPALLYMTDDAGHRTMAMLSGLMFVLYVPLAIWLAGPLEAAGVQLAFAGSYALCILVLGGGLALGRARSRSFTTCSGG